jgi:hypothetical protein
MSKVIDWGIVYIANIGGFEPPELGASPNSPTNKNTLTSSSSQSG